MSSAYGESAWMVAALLREACARHSPFICGKGSRVSFGLGIGSGPVAALVDGNPAAFVGLEALLGVLPRLGASGPSVSADVGSIGWAYLAVLACPGGRAAGVSRCLYLPTLGLLVLAEARLQGPRGSSYLLGEGALRVAVTGLGAECYTHASRAVLPPDELWGLPWEDLQAAYATVDAARVYAYGDPMPLPSVEGLARLWSALAQLCLLRGDFCTFAHLVAALLPEGVAGRQVVFVGAAGGARGTTAVFGP